MDGLWLELGPLRLLNKGSRVDIADVKAAIHTTACPHAFMECSNPPYYALIQQDGKGIAIIIIMMMMMIMMMMIMIIDDDDGDDDNDFCYLFDNDDDDDNINTL
jgi:hypothetical protein